MIYSKLIRAIITLHVIMLSLFYKISTTRESKAIRPGSPASRVSPWSSRSCPSRLSDERLARKQENARQGLPEIDPHVRKYYLISLCCNWYLFAKNLFICMLRHEAFAQWRYLDCLILGRFVLDARVVEPAPCVACYDAAIFLLWRYTMASQTKRFSLPCIEFLLEDKRGHAQYWDRRPDDCERCEHSQLLEYAIPFNAQRAAVGCTHKLRPNRTRAAWDALARVTVNYCACFTIFMVLATGLFIALALPVGVTRAGFALNYRQCFQWVESHPTETRHSSYYNRFKQDSSIHLNNTPTERDFFMPFKKLVNFDSFHSLRLALEFIETFFTLMKIGLVLNAACFSAGIIAKDVVYYCDSINERLEKLAVALKNVRIASSHSVIALRDAYYDRLFMRTTCAGDRKLTELTGHQSTIQEEVKCKTLEAEISDVQAQIADLFVQIDSYNRYISFQTLCQLFWWLSYSAVVSRWTFLPDHHSPKIEWYGVHFLATCHLLVLLMNMSAVRSSSHRMYALMASAMALDENHETSKRCWLSLMSFYAPRPMCSFTLFGSVELTSMSGLHLLAWFVGALAIGSNFSQLYNIK